MNKQSHRFAWVSAVLINVAVVAIPMCIYFFLYVESQRVYFTARYFRAVDEVTSYLKTRLEHLEYVFTFAPQPEFRKATAGRNPKGVWKTKEGGLGYAAEALRYNRAYRNLALETATSAEFSDVCTRKYECRGPGTRRKCDSLAGRAGLDRPRLKLNWINGEAELNVIDCGWPRRTSWIHQDTPPLRARLPLDDLINSDLFNGVFDQMMIVKDDGEVIARRRAPLPGFSGQFNILKHVRSAKRSETRDPGVPKETGSAAASGDNFEPLVISRLSDKSGGDAALQSAVIETAVGNVPVMLFIRPFRVPLEEYDLDTDAKPVSRVWYICGVVRRASFEAKVRQMPLTVVAVVGLLIVLGLLSWPYLKTSYLGPLEKLRPMDAHFLLASLVLGAGLLTLLLAEWSVYEGFQRRLDYAAYRIATKLKDDFAKEVELARVELLRAIDPLTGADPDKGAETKSLTCDHESINYPLYDLVLLADAQGKIDEWQQLTYREAAGPGGNIQNREYFQRAVRRSGWWRPLNGVAVPSSGSKEQYFVQRIETYDHGIKLAALSVPIESAVASEKPHAAVAVKQFLTFLNPVLPPGFGFAIIADKSGKVLFHSHDERSLIENFFVEADRNRRLEAAVKMRRADDIDGRYQGRSHSFRTQPLEGVPWTAVVFYDKTIVQGVNFELVCVVAVALALYALGFGAAVVILTFVLRDTQWSWLWPRRQLRREYRTALFAICGLILYQCILVWGLEGWWLALPIVSTPPLLIGALYLLFKSPVAHQSKRRVLAATASVTGAAGMLFSLLGLPGSTVSLIVASLAIVSTIVLVAVLRSSRQPVRPIRFRFYYLATAFTCLIALGVLPSLFIFKDAFRVQADKIVKYGQLYQMRAWEQRSAELRNDVVQRLRPFEYAGLQPPKVTMPDELGTAGIYAFKNIVLPGRGPQLFEPVPLGSYPLVDGGASSSRYMTGWLFESFPPYSDEISQIREALFEQATSFDWGWRLPGRYTIWDRITSAPQPIQSDKITFWKRAPDGPEILGMSSSRTRVDLELNGFTVWLALLVVAILYLLFSIVRSLAVRLLGLDMVDVPTEIRVPPAAELLSGNRVLIRPPTSLVQELVEAVRALGDDGRIVDSPFLVSGSVRTWSRNDNAIMPRVVLFTNCDVALLHPDRGKRLLEVLEELVHAKSKVILVCDVLPLYRLLNPAAYPESAAAGTVIAPDIALRWSTLLAAFDKDRYPETEHDPSWRECKDGVEATLLRECRWFDELRVIRERIRTRMRARPAMRSDDVIAAVLDEAGPFYRRLWLLCTRDERLLLIHMAQGNLANPKNLGTVERLLRRGLLRRDPDLQLMNRSFANFALAAEPPERIAEWEHSDTSAWDLLRWPLLAALMTGVVFIAYTQRDVFNSTVGLVGALVTGLPVILRAWSVVRDGRLNVKTDA